MSKAQTTVVTLEIRVNLPKGSNAAMLMEYVGDAIQGWGGGKAPDDPHFGLKRGEDFIVKLVKKETTYK